MNHARIKELKGTSGKTVSRRAIKSGKAGQSPMDSLMTTPTSSAPPSRITSDVSDIDFSDENQEFDDTASLFTSSDHEDGVTPAGTFNPDALLEFLQDRKRNNPENREKYLETYIRVVRTRYNEEAHDWMEPAATNLIQCFLQSANRGSTARERVLSLQAFCVTVSVAYTLNAYAETKGTLRAILTDDDDTDCCTWAIYSLAAVTVFSGKDVGQDNVAETLAFLHEIIASSGGSIEAEDNEHVVITAILCWCFVASYADDLSEFADDTLDAFVDQLDSSDLETQAMAGSGAAFILEAARLHKEETDEELGLSYSAERLLPRIRQLGKLSSKFVSRKDRRTLRNSLVSVATSLERGVGPDYSTALLNPDDPNSRDGEAEYGYRKQLRFDTHRATIDTWALSFRVDVLKVIFRGSLQRFAFDYENENVAECLEDADFVKMKW